ncbi:hypothetical protein OG883_26485 [Streptomyces sp. NBC_01142]|uniref:hypothetical protein n=1 Tax=Streptomyces sp. NBC_01142 TaxID=2975865 RepID=UPI0022592327|nr:hypothetical protein [Streptomyces sp. NBC_01142]MCX4823365.1 hypothetical protein [Streptomyces sp. NBC_01142]
MPTHFVLGCGLAGRGRRGNVAADETELLPGAPLGTGVLTVDPKLPDERWQTLHSSLDALVNAASEVVA